MPRPVLAAPMPRRSAACGGGIALTRLSPGREWIAGNQNGQHDENEREDCCDDPTSVWHLDLGGMRRPAGTPESKVNDTKYRRERKRDATHERQPVEYLSPVFKHARHLTRPPNRPATSTPAQPSAVRPLRKRLGSKSASISERRSHSRIV
jgi:hypothetical protein